MSHPQFKPEFKPASLNFNAKLFRLLIFVVCLGFIAVIYLIFQPQSLSDIDGREASASAPMKLSEFLNKAAEGNAKVTLTEAEINQMLQHELIAKQDGALSGSASVKSVLVRLKKDLAEVIVVREVFGREMTASLYFQLKQIESGSGIATDIHLQSGKTNDKSSLPKFGGRLGKFVATQGFLKMVMPDFKKIGAALSPEIELCFSKIARLKIEDNCVILDPKLSKKVKEEAPF